MTCIHQIKIAKFHGKYLCRKVCATWKATERCVLTTAALEVLGPSEKRSSRGWRDEEYDKAVAAKGEAYRAYIQSNTRGGKERYQAKRREATKLYRRNRRRFEQ